MVSLVNVQTLRGNAGTQAATTVVQNAVTAHNAIAGNAQHTVHAFTALAPNTKGMQVHLSLWAVLARNAGCTLVRLNVHNGNVALCGPQAAVTNVLAQFTATLNQLYTLATNAYNPATHGARMGFTNAYVCGLIAGMQVAPTLLAYGIGYLWAMPAPGNGTAYGLGVSAAPAPVAAPAPAKVTRTRKPIKPAA